MQNIQIKLIETKDIVCILPLLMQLNTTTPQEVLKSRIYEMSTQNYECVGMYINNTLIGIAGLWFMTRHYCGKSIEPDHVIIDDLYRNQGLGKKLFEWIYSYGKSMGCEVSELNAYIPNTKSHDFYEREGYKKLGYHFIKKI
ncbi:MAG: GNAT family N-acetyltransferase [Flavobacteriaceae bacterium]|nr:MAG: GNAT family N-acetyltransferase [Flavobacteriaceae bacterium]